MNNILLNQTDDMTVTLMVTIALQHRRASHKYSAIHHRSTTTTRSHSLLANCFVSDKAVIALL